MSLLARLGVLLVAMGALLAMGPGPGPAAAATATVNVGDFWFCNSSHQGNVCTTTINVGDTVTWQNTTATSHTSTECDSVCGSIPGSPMWNLAIGPNGTTAPLQFNQTGKFNYQCNIHPTLMMGRIVVNAAPSVGGIAQLPDVANAPLNGAASSSSSSVGLIAGSAAIAAGIVALGGAAWYARRRRVS